MFMLFALAFLHLSAGLCVCARVCVRAGLLPPGPSSGMVMLQMTAPPCQQPRAASPCQRKQPNHKHSGLEHQRGRRPAELPLSADSTQVQTLPDCKGKLLVRQRCNV